MRPHSTLPLRRAFLLLLIACVLGSALRIAEARTADDWQPGELFERVVQVLSKRFYDKRVRDEVVPELARQYRQRVASAPSLEVERQLVQEMLGHIPASHLGLLSRATHRQMMRNLAAEKAPTFGLELYEIGGGFFVHAVLESGPADEAGVRRGDRVVRIDGHEPASSTRLDWRSDDAALPDPPMHGLLAEEDDRIVLELERAPGETLRVQVDARLDSAFEATRRSAQVIDVDGRSVAFIHFWYIHHRGLDTLLARLCGNEFKDAEALVLDLRGRGGDASMVSKVLRTLHGDRGKWDKPLVALIDQNTRSAKEMMAYEIKLRGIGTLVGQTTAGALLPATFVNVGSDSVLMYPAFALGKYTQSIEGKGVEPDILAEAPGPYSAGADPIREAGLRTAAELAATREAVTAPAH